MKLSGLAGIAFSFFVAALSVPAHADNPPQAALDLLENSPLIKTALTDENYLKQVDSDQPAWKTVRENLGNAAFRRFGETRSVRVETWRATATENAAIILEYQTSFKKFPKLPAEGMTQTDAVFVGVGRDAMWHRTFYGGTDDVEGRKAFEQLMVARQKMPSNRRTDLDPKFVELAEKYLPSTPLEQVHADVKARIEKLVEACKPMGAKILDDPQYGPFGAKISDHLYLYLRDFPRGASRSSVDPFFWLIISGGPKTWANDYVPAFPGAEGAGARATGGRGGKVIYVTTLNPTGPGSIAEAFATKGPRTVLFRVSGQIVLPGGGESEAKQLGKQVTVTEPDITLDGSTAPGEGIEIKGRLALAAGNVIMRNMRWRLRPPFTKDGSFTQGNLKNIIFDHCSFAYDSDEQLRMIGNNSCYIGFTIQYCLLGPGLAGTGDHPYGPEVGGFGSVHHNIWYNTLSRSPEVDCDLIDWSYNIMANVRRGHSDRSRSRFNMVNNYIVNIQGNYNDAGYRFDYTDSVWLDGNIRETGKVIEPFQSQNSAYLKHAYDVVPVTADKPQDLEGKLVPVAGAFLPTRDATDKYFIEQFKSRTCKLPYFEREGAPWRPYGNENDNPQLYEPWDQAKCQPPAEGAKPAVDTDGDGMPDEWEIANHFNPKDPSDGSADADQDGYTNLEEYLNHTDPHQFVDYKNPANNAHTLNLLAVK